MRAVSIKNRIVNFFAERIKNVKSGRFGRERFLLTRFAYIFLPWFGHEYCRGEEWNFVLRNLSRPPAKILDVGSATSLLLYEFDKRGYDTHGIDCNSHAECFPERIKFSQGDITRTFFSDNFFDIVVAVSVIEHVGIGEYNDPIYNDGDLLAVKEIYRILQPKGILLLTVPNQKWLMEKNPESNERGYTCESIDKLLANLFRVIEQDCKMGQLLFKLEKI